MIRLTLMYYINFISFMENPDKTWDDIVAGDVQKAPPQPMLFGQEACFYHEKVRTLDYKGVRTGILCGFEFYGQQYSTI